MRNLLAILFIVTIMSSCGNEADSKSEKQTTPAVENKEVKATPVKVLEVVGKYSILEIEGESLKGNDFGKKSPMIEFDNKNKKYSTNVGCNQIMGKYELDGSTIKFSAGISTLMACPNDLEAKYLKALGEVDNFTIENFMLKVYKGDELKVIFQPLRR